MPENLSMPSMSSSRKMVHLALDLSLHALQEQVDQSLARFSYLMCGRQWGKTTLLAWELFKSMAKPYSTVWYLTNQLKQGKDTIWNKLLQIIEPAKSNFRVYETTLEIVGNNGSRLALKHTTDPDCRRGPSLSRLCIDEAQDFNGEDFLTIFRPLLSAKEAPCLFAGTKKPGSWFMKEWMAANDGKLEESKAFWFPSTSNPTIPAGEWQKIKRDLAARGRLDIWENEYICDPFSQGGRSSELRLSEFDRSAHICAPFAIPNSWRIFAGFDWGMSTKHPAACVWGALSPAGIVYIFGEYRASGKHIPDTAKALLAKYLKPEIFIIDETCWFMESDGRSPIHRFQEAGIKPVVKGPREDRAMSKIGMVKSWLKPISGPPRIQIFSTCTRLIDEIESCLWINRTGDDLIDGLRYLIYFLSSISLEKSDIEEKFEPKPVLVKFSLNTDDNPWNKDTGYIS